MTQNSAYLPLRSFSTRTDTGQPKPGQPKPGQPKTGQRRIHMFAVAISTSIVSTLLLFGGGATGPTALAAGDETPATALHPIQPCRLFDSRQASDGGEKLQEKTVQIDVTGRCGIPAAALAGSFTVTVTGTENGAGHATLFPAGAALPTASNLNWSVDGTTQANSALIKLGTGKVAVHLRGTAHLVVDAYGYFDRAVTARAGRFESLTPRRVLDSRSGLAADPNIPAAGAWDGGEARRIPLPSGVPLDATALSVNITTARSVRGGHFTAYLPGSERPTASMLNTDSALQTRAASAIVPVNDRGFMLYSSAGGEVIIDINGYFTGPSAADEPTGLFVARQPTRVLDSRDESPLRAGAVVDVDTTEVTGNVSATVANLTMVRPSDPGFVAAFPSGFAVPLISSVNVDPTLAPTANISITPSSANGIGIYSARSTDLIVDVTGYFTGTPYRGPEPGDGDRIIETRSIGRSARGRPITAYRLGTPGGTVVVAAASIHGDETDAQRVTDYLLKSATIPDGLDVWVLPVANPDGVAANTRTNGRAVDLNRNFATSDWRYQGLGTTRFSGPSAASEPETVAIQKFMLELQPSVAVWWHQVGNHVDDQRSVADYRLLVAFADLTGMPIINTYCNPSPCRGTATRFTNDNVDGATSFVVELPVVVTPTMAQRQGDALLRIGAIAADR